jgi:O-antigen/teichoic acid export membrane protein
VGRSTPLSALRILFFAFSMAIALISVVVIPFLAAGMETEDALDPVVPSVAVGVLGFVLFAVSRAFSRAERFVSVYRSQFMLRIALAEMSTLVGFVVFFPTASVIPYAVGVAWTALGFFLLAPTRRRLERLQDEIALQGCPHQLLDALQNPL